MSTGYQFASFCLLDDCDRKVLIGQQYINTVSYFISWYIILSSISVYTSRKILRCINLFLQGTGMNKLIADQCYKRIGGIIFSSVIRQNCAVLMVPHKDHILLFWPITDSQEGPIGSTTQIVQLTQYNIKKFTRNNHFLIKIDEVQQTSDLTVKMRELNHENYSRLEFIISDW